MPYDSNSATITLYARDDDKDPPSEIMIFPIWKTITTTKGNFVLTDAGAREVMQEYFLNLLVPASA